MPTRDSVFYKRFLKEIFYFFLEVLDVSGKNETKFFFFEIFFLKIYVKKIYMKLTKFLKLAKLVKLIKFVKLTMRTQSQVN